MDRRVDNGDISQLEGWLNKPIRKKTVLEAARTLPQPFLLREAVDAARLPSFVVQRVLSRSVRQGILRRFKSPMTYPNFDRHSRRWIPGGRQRRVYLYSFVEPS